MKQGSFWRDTRWRLVVAACGSLASGACIGLHDYGVIDGPPAGSDAGATDAPSNDLDANESGAQHSGAITIPADSPNPLDYVSANGAVTDKLTGLVWQQGTSEARTLDAAHSACASLALAGLEWRVPSRFELVTLIDYASPPFSKPAFLDNFFQELWTSSSSPHGYPYKLLRSGRIDVRTDSPTDHVKCVSGPPLPKAQYAQQGGTATDSLTGLVWQQGSSPQAVDYDAAHAYCASLVLGGFTSGWRLPTAKELQSIVDESSGPPSIDPRIFTGRSVAYWASTPSSDASNPNEVWVVVFESGKSSEYPKDSTNLVRCVR